jgi:hypothetical protein
VENVFLTTANDSKFNCFVLTITQQRLYMFAMNKSQARKPMPLVEHEDENEGIDCVQQMIGQVAVSAVFNVAAIWFEVLEK